MSAIEFAHDKWLSPPEDLAINEGEVHVWSVHARIEGFSQQLLRRSLSTDEKERADRFKFDKDRRLYIAAHAALRALLSAYLQVEKARIAFLSGPHGKPALAPPLAASGLEFNLSHSNQLGLVAIARGKAIGVDVEWAKRNLDFEEIARRFFTPREVAALAGLPEPLKRPAFFKCWTSKEAFLKAKGTGLSGRLDEVEIILDAEQQLHINATVPGWSLTGLAPGLDYEGALVTEAGLYPVRCYRWQPQLMLRRCQL